MKTIPRVLVKFFQPTVVQGCGYNADEIAGFAPEIAKRLVPSAEARTVPPVGTNGCAKYCTPSGDESDGPVTVMVQVMNFAERVSGDTVFDQIAKRLDQIGDLLETKSGCAGR